MKKIITLLVIGFLVAGVAQAAVLAKYEFTGGSTNDNAGNPLVSASAFNATLQDALTGADMATTPTVTFPSDLIQVAGLDATAPAAAGFVAGDYAANGHLDFSFTVQNLGAGQTIDLTDLTADYTGAFPWQSGVSMGVTATDFSTYDPAADFAGEQLVSGGTSFDLDLTVDLSSYTGLANGDTISFRFYFKEQNNRNEGGRNQQLDNIIVNGTASGPIVDGTRIGICPDSGTPTDDPGNDWNEFPSAGVTSNSIHDLNGVILDGVSVQFAAAGGVNASGENNWAGLSTQGGTAPAQFVDSVTTDLWWNMGGVTINGLNTSFKYNVYVVGQSTGAGTTTERCTLIGNKTIVSSDRTRDDNRAGMFYTFLEVSPDNTGTFSIQTYNALNNHVFNGALIRAYRACSVFRF